MFPAELPGTFRLGYITNQPGSFKPGRLCLFRTRAAIFSQPMSPASPSLASQGGYNQPGDSLGTVWGQVGDNLGTGWGQSGETVTTEPNANRLNCVKRARTARTAQTFFSFEPREPRTARTIEMLTEARSTTAILQINHSLQPSECFVFGGGVKGRMVRGVRLSDSPFTASYPYVHDSTRG